MHLSSDPNLVAEDVFKFQRWLGDLLDAYPNTPLNNLVPFINAYIP
jgi:hypothetical protein